MNQVQEYEERIGELKRELHRRLREYNRQGDAPPQVEEELYERMMEVCREITRIAELQDAAKERMAQENDSTESEAEEVVNDEN